jgi:ubiquinone/menaquinone biosynthesis C-methylase UbiE
MHTDIDRNVATAVARGFGDEWSTFRQDESNLSPEQRGTIFENYFRIFPWDALPPGGGTGIDVGCGTGRWSVGVASRVGHLHLLDVSAEALAVARENLASLRNVSFHNCSVAEIPLPDNSLDFAFSLGVLHHVPDSAAAVRAIAAKLKPGAPLLVYFYYSFDNQPQWYRGLWAISNAVRVVVARLPHPLRRVISELIAAFVYWPLARLAGVLGRLGVPKHSLPLSWYADKSFYVMRTDAYDRFCTQLEQRFSKAEIEAMLSEAGFVGTKFSDRAPFWCAVSTKAPSGQTA